MATVQALFDLAGKTAVVTGGSRGIGLELAEGLCEAGARVLITARRAPDLEQAAAGLRQRGFAVATQVANVTEPAGVEATLQAALALGEGRVDILVNNAGSSWGESTLTMPLAAWHKVLETNCTGAFLMAQAAGRVMVAQGRGGRVINIASVAGLGGSDPRVMEAVGYHTAKGGLIAFTRALATAWARHGINVNAILPGWFPTRMSQGVLAAAADAALAHIPMGRFGAPGELKGACVFLASAASSYITGSLLVVDGGQHAW